LRWVITILDRKVSSVWQSCKVQILTRISLRYIQKA
jgi:hypothetical protein